MYKTLFTKNTSAIIQALNKGTLNHVLKEWGNLKN